MLVVQDAARDIAIMAEDRPPVAPAPAPATEAEMAGTRDAVEGRRLVEARMARCTDDEQAAFWGAVQRCFSGAAPQD